MKPSNSVEASRKSVAIVKLRVIPLYPFQLAEPPYGGPAARRLLRGFVLIAADEAHRRRLLLAADRKLQGDLFECRALLVALPGRDREGGIAALIMEVLIERQPAL